MIDFDGAGSPFCIDERDGRVVLIDHELLFDMKRRNKMVMFVNSGVPELAESLLVYQHSSPKLHQHTLRGIDPPALEKGAFWTYQYSD